MNILILNSYGTESAAKRISSLLASAHNVTVADNRPEGRSYELVILHNRRDALPDEPTLMYCCGSSTKKILEHKQEVDSILKNKPAAIWTNSWTAAGALRKRLPFMLADRIRCMYRPKRINIPDTVDAMPEAKRIMWYWRPGWQYQRSREIQIKNIEAMRQLKNLEILLVSSKQEKGVMLKPEGHGFEHVVAMGRADFSAELPKVHGLVRLTEGLDFGRSTFDVLAHGRWVLYLGMKEPHIESVESIEDVPKKVEKLLADSKLCDFERRWEYTISNFEENVLRNKWVKEIDKVYLQSKK